jgi:hypothetical protein
MYTLSPITPRVSKIREKYVQPDQGSALARYRIVTEFYM